MLDSLRPVGPCALLSLVVMACGGGPGAPDAGGPADASLLDSALSDADVADSSTDAATSDGAMLDAALEDAQVDAGTEDAQVDAPPTSARLTLVFEGDGHGMVASADPALSCTASCTADFPIGTVLNLVATREDDSTFDRFTGPCTGVDGSCDLTLDADATVSVRFDALHNYVFVTSERFSPGALGGAVAADALCNAAAAAGDARLHGRTYVAWLSDSTSDARDRLGEASGWQRLDGLPFIASRESMLGNATARVLYPPRLDEQGVDVLPPADAPSPSSRPLYFATGIQLTGQAGGNCADWTTTAASFVGGTADSANVNWTGSQGGACTISTRLLCLGNDFATPITPPAAPTGATRAVFTTSVPEPLRGAGLAALDGHCQSEANTVGLTGTYLALLATPGASALSRFTDVGGPWVRMDGVVVIRDPASFLDSGAPDSGLGTYRSNGATTQGGYATGAPSLTAPGTNETTCAGYTSALITDFYSYSDAGRTYPGAMGTLGIPCSSFQTIVCMAQ